MEQFTEATDITDC